MSKSIQVSHLSSSSHDLIELLNNRLVEVDTTPDLNKTKPVVVLKQEEIAKLLRQFEINRETWIALKFNETIFVIWKELIFLHIRENCENKL
jgi:hypothetical protein